MNSNISFLFFVNSVLFGIGLAADAFSVSIANALAEPYMKKRKFFSIAGVFGFFQLFMPMLGWLLVHYMKEAFQAFENAIPWIALILLLFIGIKMIFDTVKENKKESDENDLKKVTNLSFGGLLVQGIATSIDALSVGFTIADLVWYEALLESAIIGGVTFGICIGGLLVGKAVGAKLRNISGIIGGIILICIGIEIFLTHFFG